LGGYASKRIAVSRVDHTVLPLRKDIPSQEVGLMYLQLIQRKEVNSIIGQRLLNLRELVDGVPPFLYAVRNKEQTVLTNRKRIAD
jgi:hypothetical protein